MEIIHSRFYSKTKFIGRTQWCIEGAGGGNMGVRTPSIGSTYYVVIVVLVLVLFILRALE